MKLTLKPVDAADKNRVKQIYTASFSREDRMPFVLMRVMAKFWHTRFYACYDGASLCGFIYYAVSRALVFVMFFAVDDKLRGRGYGSGILKEVQALYPNKKIVITIEKCEAGAPDLEERKRRKRFYLKNGYAETGYLVKMGKEQEILIKNGTFDRREFILFFMRYSNLTVVPRVWPVSPQ